MGFIADEPHTWGKPDDLKPKAHAPGKVVITVAGVEVKGFAESGFVFSGGVGGASAAPQNNTEQSQ